MSCDLIGRFKAEHLEKPPTKSKTPKTPQKGQTPLVVGLPGALVCNKETERKQARQGYRLSPLDASVAPRRGSTRRTPAVAHKAKGSESS